MHQFAIAAISLLLTLSIVDVRADGKPSGENCTYSDLPPSEAGESFTPLGQDAIVVRTFPRLVNLKANYTGCQVTWMSRTSNPKKINISLVYFLNGRAQSVWPEPLDPVCKRGESQLTHGCLLPAQFIALSYPAGCIVHGANSGKIPADCMAAFNEEFALHDRKYVKPAERENAPSQETPLK